MTWLKRPHTFALFTGTAIILAGCSSNPEAHEADESRVTPISNGRAPLERVVPREVTSYSEARPSNGDSTPVSQSEELEPDQSIEQSEVPTKKSQPKAVERPSKKEVRYVDASTLNVRSSADPKASVRDQLPRNATVSVTTQQTDSDGQGWSRIEYNNKGRQLTGWVATNYLSDSMSSPPPKATKPIRTASGSRSGYLKKTTFNKPSGDYFEQFERLNYKPVPKPSYPGNPRINAKAVYVSLNILSSERFEKILETIDSTELNALVIDFKDDVGWLLTKSATAENSVPRANARAKYNDISQLIQRLKAKNIYLIARIVTFKDPLYVKAHPSSAILDNSNGKVFKSGDGLAWASPYDPAFRAYNIAIAKEAADAGFNEIQFDYVRFPDVKRSADLNYRNKTGEIKAAAIQSFLLEARTALAPKHVYIAADVFGMITTTVDDMRIGQYWEAISNAVDFICPMMYPSHYANTVYQLPVPDARPYDLIYRGLDDALARDKALSPPAKIRPWLQGFTATWVKGHINYGPAQIKAQIRAAADQGVNSYLIWHPTGRYNAAAYR